VSLKQDSLNIIVTQENPKSTYAMHIWNNTHQFGPIEATLQLLKPCNKGIQMNSLENFYIQLYQKHGSLIEEQNTNEHNPLYAIVQI
jgi:hypothetical protein